MLDILGCDARQTPLATLQQLRLTPAPMSESSSAPIAIAWRDQAQDLLSFEIVEYFGSGKW